MNPSETLRRADRSGDKERGIEEWTNRRLGDGDFAQKSSDCLEDGLTYKKTIPLTKNWIFHWQKASIEN